MQYQTQRDRSLEQVRKCNRLFVAAGFPCIAVVIEQDPRMVEFVVTDHPAWVCTYCDWEDAFPVACRAVEVHRGHT